MVHVGGCSFPLFFFCRRIYRQNIKTPQEWHSSIVHTYHITMVLGEYWASRGEPLENMFEVLSFLGAQNKQRVRAIDIYNNHLRYRYMLSFSLWAFSSYCIPSINFFFLDCVYLSDGRKIFGWVILEIMRN